ncbi:MAG TPA: HipA domain-containing protein [Candidatus Nanopelagicaceae bacterium]|nr:HipA domain-containing protein [Candidatus Nanopelagicaceae bacterium]
MAIEREPVEVTVEIDGDELVAGVLRVHDRRGQSATFAYSEGYLRDPRAYPLDPALQLGLASYQTPPGKEIFNAFSDGAPDRWGRSLMMRAARGRQPGTGPRSLTTADFLLGTRDDLRQGAIRLRRPGSGHYWSPSGEGVPHLLSLPALLGATDRFVEGDLDDEAQAIKDLVAAGSSLGGARPKAAMRASDGALAMAKFPRKGSDEWDVAGWEKLEADLADRAGISVASSELIKVAGRNVLVLARFDRAGDRRIGFASALTMLEASDHETRSYLEIAEVLTKESNSPGRDLQELYRRIVFSVLTSNTDDHLRNHGFLRQGRGWALAPAYDMNPSPEASGHQATAVGIDDTRSSLELCVEVSSEFRLQLAEAKLIVASIAAATSTWRQEATRMGLPAQEVARMAAAFESPERALVPKLTAPRVAMDGAPLGEVGP